MVGGFLQSLFCVVQPSGTTNWPRFNSTVEEAMVLDYPTYPEIGLASSRCDFWDMIMKEL